MKFTAFIILVCLSFVSCAHLDVFEKTAVIPQQTWYYNNKPSFSFNIPDTSAAYNVFIIVRHTDAYQYNNIWLSLSSHIPGEPARSQNIDITLGTDQKGWLGDGMDDIYELRKNISPGPIPFKRAGTYTFTIGQIMRENPLRHILNVGVRVEKVGL